MFSKSDSELLDARGLVMWVGSSFGALTCMFLLGLCSSIRL